MSTMEAPMLPVVEETEKRSRPMFSFAEASGVFMGSEPIPGLLMLRCSAVSHHAVREAARHTGLSLSIEYAENRLEFLDEMRRGAITIILAGAEGLPDLPVREVFDRARNSQPAIPVVLVGGHAEESEAIRLLKEGAAEYLPSSELDHLPSVLARAVKVRESSTAQARVQVELERAASMLRENQKLITVGRLAASIAHEINNPLESVTNLLYLLGEEKELSTSARGYLALAQRELERVGQISRQTLNFSRETTAPVRTRLDELMEEVLSLYSRRIAEKSVRVERQYDCEEEATVYPGEMRQVLSNLVTNAIEASSMRGRLRVRIRGARSWSDPGIVGIRISVGDNGSGIAPAVQRRLGEPFFTTKGQRGTGLGLWVTRSIVQRYGGEIQLRSSVAPGRHGTVFSIFLPVNLGPRIVGRQPDDDGGTGSSSPGRAVGTTPSSPRNRFNPSAVKRRASGE